MGKLTFYPRLAGRNLWQNRLYCLPYALTGAACAGMLYILRYLTYSRMVAEMSVYVSFMLTLGTGVLLFLTVWIMTYANGFVMRQRRREMALYNILGMEKRHLAAVMGWENFYLFVLCTAAGLAGGALLSKLVLLGLMKLLDYDVTMGFEFTLPGAAQTAAWMAALYLALYLRDLGAVRRTSAIELLNSSRAGEREPKSRVFLALFGLAALLGGYAIAAYTTGLLAVLTMFFVAVVLVIIGTHCLFGAGSVAALKALRKNRSFYYKPRNFTAVSGLIYRMNQNARGLANICILSTVVLVSVSVSFCLYANVALTARAYCPDEIQLRMTYASTAFAEDGAAARKAVAAALAGIAAEHGCPDGSIRDYDLVSFSASEGEPGRWALSGNTTAESSRRLYFLTAADYAALGGQAVTLAPGAALYSGDAPGGTLSLGGLPLTVAGRADAAVLSGQTDIGHTEGALLVVLPDRAALAEVAALAGHPIQYFAALNPGVLTAEEIDALARALLAEARVAADGGVIDPQTIYAYTYVGMYAQFHEMFGSFVFLGCFLAIIFTLATVLIIYYKQLTEGYEDRARFVILQKVGMDAAEVRATINTQVRMVFLLPLAMAGLHVVAASPMLIRMLGLFGLSDTGLFLPVAAVTFAVFAVIYLGVYALTARRYYAIVRR